ncbi:MAG: hypothetical protein ABIN97_00555 [Ginsengibacter sp.]
MTKAFFKSGIFLFFIIRICYAQVPVGIEPRHHKIFQNAYIRILDVRIVPGDTTLFHTHEKPSVFIVLNNAKTGAELFSEGEISDATVTNGNIWFEGFYYDPLIHRIWNIDTTEFHVLEIELLNKTYKEIDASLPQKSIRMLFNEKPVRGFSGLLSARSTINLGVKKYPLLVIALNDFSDGVTVNDKLFKEKGKFLFIPEGRKITLVNKGTVAAQFVILELK